MFVWFYVFGLHFVTCHREFAEHAFRILVAVICTCQRAALAFRMLVAIFCNCRRVSCMLFAISVLFECYLQILDLSTCFSDRLVKVLFACYWQYCAPSKTQKQEKINISKSKTKCLIREKLLLESMNEAKDWVFQLPNVLGFVPLLHDRRFRIRLDAKAGFKDEPKLFTDHLVHRDFGRRRAGTSRMAVSTAGRSRASQTCPCISGPSDR